MSSRRAQFDGIEGLGNYDAPRGMGGLFDDLTGGLGEGVLDVIVPGAGLYTAAEDIYNAASGGGDQPLNQTAPTYGGALPPPSSYAPMAAEDTGGGAAEAPTQPGGGGGGAAAPAARGAGASAAAAGTSGGIPTIAIVAAAAAIGVVAWLLLKD